MMPIPESYAGSTDLMTAWFKGTLIDVFHIQAYWTLDFCWVGKVGALLLHYGGMMAIQQVLQVQNLKKDDT